MGLWDIGRLPYRKTVPHRNRPQASGPNPWIKEPRRDVATDTTPSHAPVEIRFLTDHRWHVIQSPCSPAGRSVPYWRGDRFIRPTRIGLPFGLQHTVWANQRKTRRRSLSNTEAILQPATWPDSTRVPDALKPYWQTKDDLSVVHGLLLKAERIVIPTAISLEMFDRVQEGHQGVTKCRERAKRVLWWPGLLNEELTKKELMIPSVVPDSSSRSVTYHPSPPLKCPQICVYQTWYTGSGRLRDLIFRPWHLKIQYYSTYFLLLLSFVTSLETILFNMFSFVIIIC